MSAGGVLSDRKDLKVGLFTSHAFHPSSVDCISEDGWTSLVSISNIVHI